MVSQRKQTVTETPQIFSSIVLSVSKKESLPYGETLLTLIRMLVSQRKTFSTVKQSYKTYKQELFHKEKETSNRKLIHTPYKFNFSVNI